MRIYLDSSILPNDKKDADRIKSQAIDLAIYKDLLCKFPPADIGKRTPTRRIYLPLTLHFDYFHCLQYPLTSGHLGVQKTLERLKQGVFWPRMKDDVKEWIRECEPCQRAKVESKLPMGMMEIAKPRRGNCYAFVMVDAGSRWLDVRLTETAEVDTTIAQIVKFTKRWGYPKTIVSDNATTFRSARFQAKYAEMGYQVSLKYSPHMIVVGQEARFPVDLDSDTDNREPLPPDEAERLHHYMLGV
uniref:RNA-directed DNA polymerase n=1 Tax=Strigamia maritima TaxID=126957 RepID=T1IZ47_STRMM